MDRFRSLLVLVLAVPAFSRTPAVPDTVRVDGGQIAGTIADGVRIFKGIPFAAPPTGDLRWKPPQAVIAWSGVKTADAFSPECPQSPYAAGSAYAMPAAPTSEDCLYLNVWSTATAEEKQPVMVWIHGGAWTRGSGSIGTYDGANLAKKGVVLVTVNYRIGPLGFLAHPELTAESPQHASGNYGILDNVASLQWVQRNIAAFGGDPSRVTIFGESAGSWSVNTLQATPLARGLFHRAIGESGSTFNHNPTLAEAEKGGMALAKSLGAASLAALRAVPAEQLTAVPAFRTETTVDGWVLGDQVHNIFTDRKHNDVPVLIGSNADELTTLSNSAFFPKTMDAFGRLRDAQFPGMASEFDAAYPVKSDADVTGALLAVGRDQLFTLGMRTWARMVTAGGRKAFLYQFTHVPPGPNPKWGAYHAAELAYVFNNVGSRRWALDLDTRLADQMSDYWVNFARTGDPNGKGLPTWPAYDAAAEPYLDLGDVVQARNHLLKVQLDFLEQVQQRRQAPR
jgi:para-nitrobenzyl esterase